MPTVYSYHQVTKIFTDSSEALPSPNEEGVWLLPAFATFVEPPPYMSPQQTPQWNGTNWEIIPAPITVVEEVIFGWMATDDEKRIILFKLANDYMDGAANALGFANIADAVAMASAGSSSQVGRDAISLRDWRVGVITIINEVLATVIGNTNPMPSVHGIMKSFPQLVRTFPQPDLSPPGKIYEPITPPIYPTWPTQMPPV